MRALGTATATGLAGLLAAAAVLGLSSQAGSAAHLDVDGGVVQTFVIDGADLPEAPEIPAPPGIPDECLIFLHLPRLLDLCIAGDLDLGVGLGLGLDSTQQAQARAAETRTAETRTAETRTAEEPMPKKPRRSAQRRSDSPTSHESPQLGERISPPDEPAEPERADEPAQAPTGSPSGPGPVEMNDDTATAADSAGDRSPPEVAAKDQPDTGEEPAADQDGASIEGSDSEGTPSQNPPNGEATTSGQESEATP